MTMPVSARGPLRPPPAGRMPVPPQRRPPERRPEQSDPLIASTVTARDRAILLAVAAGRCTISPEPAGGLLVDGRPVADQFAGHRLVAAGLVRLVAQPPGRPSTMELTPAGTTYTGLPITA